jgi:predicted SprT family Zn-dependent metalloprotease
MTHIPARIRVGTKMYSVDVVQSMRRKDTMGRIYYDMERIEIAKRNNVTNRRYTQDEIDDTFWHELTHAILYEMQHRLYDDEKFVTEFAGHLAKAIKSAQFK